MIIDKYKMQIERLRAEGTDDEWYLSKIIDSSVAGTNASDAFEAMNVVIEVMLDEAEVDMFYEHTQMALSLAQLANTTELPMTLSSSHKQLIVRAKELGEAELSSIRQLLEWFRIRI
jgi:hypothetical protein